MSVPEGNLPTRRGHRLYQNLDVSSEARSPEDGDGLVYDKSRGMWVPRSIQVSIEPGDIPDGAIDEVHLANNAVSTRTIQGGAITHAKMAPNSVSGTHIVDGSATDSKIGNRTVDDGVTVTTSTAYNTGSVTDLFSRITSRIRQIIGGTSWRSTVPISLTQLASHRARHYTGGADPLTPANIGAAAANHTHSNATQAVAGFLSPADKLKIDDAGRFWHATNSTSTSLSPYATSFSFISGLQVNLDRQGTWLIHLNLTITTTSSTAINDDWNVEAQIRWQANQSVIAEGFIRRPQANHSPATLSLTGTYNQTNTFGGMIEVYVRNNYPLQAGGHTLYVPNNSSQRVVAIYLG